MTKPMKNQHHGITSEPTLNTGENCDRQPHVKPGDNLIFGGHNSLSNASNIAPIG